MAFDMPHNDGEEPMTDGGTEESDEVVRELRETRYVLTDIKDILMTQSGDDDD